MATSIALLAVAVLVLLVLARTIRDRRTQIVRDRPLG